MSNDRYSHIVIESESVRDAASDAFETEWLKFQADIAEGVGMGDPQIDRINTMYESSTHFSDLMTAFINSVKSPIDEIGAGHYLLDHETGKMWKFDPKTTDPNDIIWLNENHNRDALQLKGEHSRILSGLETSTNHEIIDERRSIYAAFYNSDEFEEMLYERAKFGFSEKPEFDVDKLLAGENPFVPPVPDADLSLEQIRAISPDYAEGTIGDSIDKIEAIYQNGEAEEYSFSPIYIFDETAGFGPRVDLPLDVIDEHLSSTTPPREGIVRPNDYPETYSRSHFSVVDEQYLERYGSEQRINYYNKDFVVFEMDGQKYAIAANAVDTDVNPDYEPLPYLDGRTNEMYPYQRNLYQRDDLLEAGAKEYNDGPMGSYLGVPRINPSALGNIITMENDDYGPALEHLRSLFEERGIEPVGIDEPDNEPAPEDNAVVMGALAR